MKGQIKVLGTNHGLRAFEGFDAEGSLISVDKDHHCLMLGDEKLFYQIYRTIHTEDHIEYEGWCTFIGDKDTNVGRMGIKFTPKNA